MNDEKKPFTVTDRRSFTAEGQSREDGPAQHPEPTEPEATEAKPTEAEAAEAEPAEAEPAEAAEAAEAEAAESEAKAEGAAGADVDDGADDAAVPPLPNGAHVAMNSPRTIPTMGSIQMT